MFNNLGIQWAATLLALISLVLAPSPLRKYIESHHSLMPLADIDSLVTVFYIYGSRIRERSKFAPGKDLERRRELEEEEILPKKSDHALWGDAKHGLKAAKEVKGEEQKGEA